MDTITWCVLPTLNLISGKLWISYEMDILDLVLIMEGFLLWSGSVWFWLWNGEPKHEIWYGDSLSDFRREVTMNSPCTPFIRLFNNLQNYNPSYIDYVE